MWCPICFIVFIQFCQSVVCDVYDAEITMPFNETNDFDYSCRTERGYKLSVHDFKLDTCARCYYYLPPFTFAEGVKKFEYNVVTSLLHDPLTNISYRADPENSDLPIFKTFKSPSIARKWIACCREAIACCHKMITDSMPNDGATYCPRTWDGWQCWPDTPAGTTAENICQEHIHFQSGPSPCPKYVERTCWKNGSWFISEWNAEWTNYSSCGKVEDQRRLQYFHIAMYAITIVFLLPALFIFITYKQLQVHRITMHKNLFTSLVFNAVACIIFKTVVLFDELESSKDRMTLFEENGIGCKLLYLMTKYTRMTTYMWMFCEGFYLHKLIAAAFAEQKSLTVYYVIGWVFPIFPVLTFAILRWFFADEQCWAVAQGTYEWVINSPNLLSLVLNLIFLCNIIRVLVTKLRAAHANEPSQFSKFHPIMSHVIKPSYGIEVSGLKKTVRATLVLVPLFGLHFFLVIYKPQSVNCSTLEGHTFFTFAMDGLQGLMVSLIFCYLNGEVTELLCRSCYRIRLRYNLDTNPTSITNVSDFSTSASRSRHSSEANIPNSVTKLWRRNNKAAYFDGPHPMDFQPTNELSVKDNHLTEEQETALL